MKYTVIPGVILAKICDEDFLVATGSARGRVPYVEALNPTGAFFFSKMSAGFSTEEILKQASELYETPESAIAPSFERFLADLQAAGYIHPAL